MFSVLQIWRHLKGQCNRANEDPIIHHYRMAFPITEDGFGADRFLLWDFADLFVLVHFGSWHREGLLTMLQLSPLDSAVGS